MCSSRLFCATARFKLLSEGDEERRRERWSSRSPHLRLDTLRLKGHLGESVQVLERQCCYPPMQAVPRHAGDRCALWLLHLRFLIPPGRAGRVGPVCCTGDDPVAELKAALIQVIIAIIAPLIEHRLDPRTHHPQQACFFQGEQRLPNAFHHALHFGSIGAAARPFAGIGYGVHETRSFHVTPSDTARGFHRGGHGYSDSWWSDCSVPAYPAQA